MSSLNSNKQEIASLGAHCTLLLAPVQEGGWAGSACQGRWPPVCGICCLYIGRRDHARLTVLSDNQFCSGRTVRRVSIISNAQGTSIPPLPLHYTTLYKPVN